MTTVLVTGKGGQLASCIESVVKDYGNINFVFRNSVDLDITDKAQTELVFKSINGLDYCINCAAHTAVDKAESEASVANDVNHLGAKNLAMTCKENSVTLIHISTDFVFDGAATEPYSEEAKTNPLSVYGKTKLDGENAIRDILPNHFIIRTSWLYSEYGNNFLKTMLRLGNERDELSVVDDQIGSPTYARDLAGVILKIIDSNSKDFGIYHYSNEGVASWYDFAKAIFKENNNNEIELLPIKSIEYPTPAMRPQFSVLDKTKIKEVLKVEIPYWKDSLVKAMSYLKQQN